MRCIIFFSAFVALSSHAFVRTPLFDARISKRAAILERQTEIFSQESAGERERPIWLHGGDSLSTAYNTRTVLRDMYKLAATDELPEPSDPDRLATSLPSLEYSWYSGSKINWGLLGRLEAFTKGAWVLISGALAATTLVPLPPLHEDQLGRLQNLMVTQHDRVKLITFSLGANDLCSGKNPLPTPRDVEKLNTRLTVLKQSFPSAKLITWDVIDVVNMRNFILDGLGKLPANTATEQTQKARIIAFCKKSWNQSCEPAEKTPAALQEWHAAMQRILAPYVSQSINVFRHLEGDVLDAMSADCFHPSFNTQALIADAIMKAYVKNREAVTP